MSNAFENMKRTRRPKLDTARDTSLSGVTQTVNNVNLEDEILERGKRRNVHMMKGKDQQAQLIVMENSITLETLFEGFLDIASDNPEILSQAVEYAKKARALRVKAGQRAKLKTMNRNSNF